jgi:hypothetical protein
MNRSMLTAKNSTLFQMSTNVQVPTPVDVAVRKRRVRTRQVASRVDVTLDTTATDSSATVNFVMSYARPRRSIDVAYDYSKLMWFSC